MFVIYNIIIIYIILIINNYNYIYIYLIENISVNSNNDEKAIHPESTTTSTTTTSNAISKKSNRTFCIDFVNGEDVLEEDIFKPADNIPTLNITTYKKNNFLLPEDSHFSSRDFLKLFLKPNVIVNF